MIRWIKDSPRWVKAVMVMFLLGIMCVHPATRFIVIFLLPFGPGLNEMMFFALMATVGVTVVLKVVIDFLMGRRNALRSRDDKAMIIRFIRDSIGYYVNKHPDDLREITDEFYSATMQCYPGELTPPAVGNGARLKRNH